MPGPGLGHLGDRQAADDRRLAVVHQELVVGLLLLEDEAEVGRGQRLDRRALGVELHQDLAVVGHVRGDRQTDTGLLELHVGAGRPAGARVGVDDADRRFLTHEDVGLAVVERRDDRLGLDVGQLRLLQRAQERGQREAADAGRVDQVERRAGDARVGVADRRHRVAAQVDDVDGLVEQVARPAVGSGRCTSLLKNWFRLPRSYLMPSCLDVGPVDEDDLRLDRELRGADVEAAHEVADARRCGSGCR